LKKVAGLFHLFKANRFIKLMLFCLLLVGMPGCNNYKKIYPEKKDIIEAVYASGKMIAENEHSMYASQTGTVISKLVNEGDTVSNGQLLYVIKKEKLAAGLPVSTSPLVNEMLKTTSAATPGADKLFIKSDCDCLVYEATKEMGQTVRQSELLILLGEKNKRLAELSVDQSDITRVKTGQLALLKSDMTGDTIYEAEVKKIFPVMNEANQTFRIEVVLKKPFDPAFIHNSVEGNVIIRRKSLALVLPANAVLEGDSVYVKKKDGIQKIKIVPGIMGIDFIEVISGIDEKTPVIIKDRR